MQLIEGLELTEYESAFIMKAVTDIMLQGDVALKDKLTLYDELPQDVRVCLEKLLYKYSKNLMAVYLYFVMKYPYDFEQYYSIARTVFENYENKQREEKK